MEIKQLKSFVTVAECKSFSRAAQILYISQPSISTHISMLEQEVGVKLIERTSKSLALTDAGREFYEHALSILKINDKMLKEIGSGTVACIHIGASTVPSAYILPELIADYVKSYKECSFQVVQSDSRKVIDGVLEGIYDVGFVGKACHEKGIESRIVAKDEMILITPDNDFYRNIDSVKDILGEPFILREEGSGSGEMFKNILAEYDFPERAVNVIARVNDHEAVINMVEQGVGVACISSLALKSAAGISRKVLSWKLPASVSGREFCMIYKHNSLKKEIINDFVNNIKLYSQYEIFGQNETIDSFIDTLGLTGNPVISVVGAGGKSTVIEAIADEYADRGQDVIITTTTHIRYKESDKESDKDFNAKDGNVRGKKKYIGIPMEENGIRKLKAPSEETLKELIEKRTCPILIEADGSKGLPCKAPAEYEPVLRLETEVVIGVLSSRCIGGKIKDVCHRPEMVSRLLKKGKNDIITDKDLEVIFQDSNGLMKGVTQGMKYVPILRIG